MGKDNRLLAYQAIEENTKDSTVAKVCKWVLDAEVNGKDTTIATNKYFMKKFGWSDGTTRTALSYAKKSGLVIVIGRGKSRTLELNDKLLKEKMSEILARRSSKRTLKLEDLKGEM